MANAESQDQKTEVGKLEVFKSIKDGWSIQKMSSLQEAF